MSITEFRRLRQFQHSNALQHIHAIRPFPSRRAAKSTSHSNINNPDKKNFRVIPGVGLETQLRGYK
jgi:hypothetical protein